MVELSSSNGRPPSFTWEDAEHSRLAAFSYPPESPGAAQAPRSKSPPIILLPASPAISKPQPPPTPEKSERDPSHKPAENKRKKANEMALMQQEQLRKQELAQQQWEQILAQQHSSNRQDTTRRQNKISKKIRPRDISLPQLISTTSTIKTIPITPTREEHGLRQSMESRSSGEPRFRWIKQNLLKHSSVSEDEDGSAYAIPRSVPAHLSRSGRGILSKLSSPGKRRDEKEHAPPLGVRKFFSHESLRSQFLADQRDSRTPQATERTGAREANGFAQQMLERSASTGSTYEASRRSVMSNASLLAAPQNAGPTRRRAAPPSRLNTGSLMNIHVTTQVVVEDEDGITEDSEDDAHALTPQRPAPPIPDHADPTARVVRKTLLFTKPPPLPGPVAADPSGGPSHRDGPAPELADSPLSQQSLKRMMATWRTILRPDEKTVSVGEGISPNEISTTTRLEEPCARGRWVIANLGDGEVLGSPASSKHPSIVFPTEVAAAEAEPSDRGGTLVREGSGSFRPTDLGGHPREKSNLLDIHAGGSYGSRSPDSRLSFASTSNRSTSESIDEFYQHYYYEDADEDEDVASDEGGARSEDYEQLEMLEYSDGKVVWSVAGSKSGVLRLDPLEKEGSDGGEKRVIRMIERMAQRVQDHEVTLRQHREGPRRNPADRMSRHRLDQIPDAGADRVVTDVYYAHSNLALPRLLDEMVRVQAEQERVMAKPKPSPEKQGAWQETRLVGEDSERLDRMMKELETVLK
ncbi:uncharacterized protein VTP21DRAFT_172 [Calcarisporiella thermophila]|uniref:uncharacterized protein n=1 Tax=Calcarisporiella thermophila TaxID=911321 RepID=UPI003743982C